MPLNPTDTISKKPELGAHVRDILTARYGSMAAAAEALAVPYERLKKSILRNSFSARDLEVILPSEGLDSLRRTYDVNVSRRAETIAAGRPRLFDLYASIETGFRAFQRGVRDIDFSKFVDSLYDNIGTSEVVQAMTLFCADTSRPVEWSQEQAQKTLANALDHGAIVLYMMETDLIGTIRSDDIAKDDLDRQFGKFLDRLDDFRDEETSGFVALVRVRKCAFCVPYQKPTLFSEVSNDDETPARHYSLTTVDVPELSNGDGALGTAVLPQRDEVAKAMRDYLIDLIRDLDHNEAPKPEDFHFLGSAGRRHRTHEIADIVGQLEIVTRYR